MSDRAATRDSTQRRGTGRKTMGENDSSKAQGNVTQLRPAFAISPFTVIVTLVRIGLILLNAFPDEIPRWLQSRALQSVIIRPTETLLHAKEGYAIQNLSATSQFRDAYQGSFLHIPPLVFMMLRPFLETSNHWRNVLWGFILLLVDICVAFQLEQIGLGMLRGNNDSEEELQRKMPENIRPERAHVFGIYRFPRRKTQSFDTKEPGPQSSSNGTCGEEALKETPIISMVDAPCLAALLYYGNPATVLAGGLFQSVQNVWCLFLLLGIREAFPGGSASLSAFWLAMGMYGDLWYVVYLIPAALLIAPKRIVKDLLVSCYLSLHFLFGP